MQHLKKSVGGEGGGGGGGLDSGSCAADREEWRAGRAAGGEASTFFKPTSLQLPPNAQIAKGPSAADAAVSSPLFKASLAFSVMMSGNTFSLIMKVKNTFSLGDLKVKFLSWHPSCLCIVRIDK